jgi:ATPase family associated with various cellular activities (AAA)/Winged helix domain, variant
MPPLHVCFATLDERVRRTVEQVAERDPNPLDPYRGLYITDQQARWLTNENETPHVDEALAHVAGRLGLDALDSQILALCAAPEISPHYGRLYGYLHDDASRRLASPALMMRLLAEPGRADREVLDRLAADAPLRHRHVVRMLDTAPDCEILRRPIKVADRIVSELLGPRLDRPEWEARATRVDATASALGCANTVTEIRRSLDGPSRMPPLIAGPDAALAAAAGAGRPLLVIGLEAALDPLIRADAILAAALEGRMLCAGGLEDYGTDDLSRLLPPLLAEAEPSLYLTTTTGMLALERWFPLRVEVPTTTVAEREAAWRRLTGRDDVADVARAFRMSIGQIEDAARLVEPEEELARAARRVSGLRLADLARRLDARYEWEDLVLPEHQRRLLHSLSGYLRHRDVVLGDWGYERAIAPTQGLKVLFAGDSGTGKTMAAQVVARDLGLDLYAVDVATIVSKYIGETEKNLRRIFTAAERSSAMLFFDEADALFGRRSEVRDSHDRYANVEVAYLLQRMEQHPGAVILATNLRQNIDQAFLRRLDFVIEFPVPAEADRARIWRRMLPPTAPLADDVDVEFLARKFTLSGGGIRNASVAAAFIAAEEAADIGMAHLIRAIGLEYDKLGKLTLESEFEHFHDLVRR